MEDTENYLNSILQKRLGSVANYGYFSKNANTVTRLPIKQQKLQTMPTVFRVKTQTIFRTTGVMPGEAKQNIPNQLHQEKKENDGQNQRVQYIAISKRIQSKKEELIAPTVDVSKYRKTTYISPNSIPCESNNQQQQQSIQKKTQISKHQQHNLQIAQNNSIEKGKEDEIIKKQIVMEPTIVSNGNQPNSGSYPSKRKRIFREGSQRNEEIVE